MEIHQDDPHEKDTSYLHRACHSKGVIHHHLCFGRDSKAGRGVGNVYRKKKRDSAGVP